MRDSLEINRKRICRGSRDGFAAHQFHAKCDGKGPTLIVIQSTVGNIFGLFCFFEYALCIVMDEMR